MMRKNEFRSQLIKAPEFRTYATGFEIRELTEDSDVVVVEGYASMTERDYEMWDMFGEYTERIRRGAFSKTLSERADVAFLANHEGLTMARTTNATLELAEDEKGLRQTAKLDKRRSDVRDLVLAIERGDIDQMSFAFRVLDQEWNDDFDERTITEISLHRGDVSAVNYGANPNTVIGARAFPHARDAQLAELARQLEEGVTMTPEFRTYLARIVRALPMTEPEEKAEVASATDELTGLNLTLALRELLEID